MGFIKDLFILGGIKVLSAVLEKLDANKSHDHHAEHKNTPSNLNERKQTVVESNANKKKSLKRRKCARCDIEIWNGSKIDGKIVCDACAKIIIAEKKQGYAHGPGFGRLSPRCCTRCGVDLLLLDEEKIDKINGKEYCDICATKLLKALEHSREVVEQILSYMKKLFPDTTYEIDDDGEYWIKSPKNALGHCINIWIDHEVTLGFADWYSHYSYQPSEIYCNCMDDFYHHLNMLVHNELCAADSYYYKEDGYKYWGGSTLLSEEQLTESNLYDAFGGKTVVCSFWNASKDKTFVIKNSMYELKKDAFYSIIQQYPSCCLDYCIIKRYQDYPKRLKHRDVVQFAMEKFSHDSFDITKARGQKINAKQFLSLPNRPWKRTFKGGVHFIHEVVGEKLQYWYAFLEPPHGGNAIKRNGHVIQKSLCVEAFEEVNHALFPNGSQSLTVFEWTTNWAPYFDDGHEWWGTGCWSIYDKSLDRYVVILASATD